MIQLQKKARIAGFLYLLVAVTGPFVLLYVPGKLFVAGDPAATAAKIAAHLPLFRAYIVVELLSELFFIATVLALFLLFKDTGRRLAFLMLILVLIDAPSAFQGVANHLSTLSLVQDPDAMTGFDATQRAFLSTIQITLDRQGLPVSELFWGLWLLPLAVLVYRSGFLPRFLGIWLFLNGIAYVVISMTGILLPEYSGVVSTVTLPILFGEIAFTLWLLIFGAKRYPFAASVPGSAQG
ncbi:MAG TPA: DUF4386 domain-containing protein [Bacteroidota bacterium]|nr:DUF4386 domain-containing protein [Bacteroidota bacterium]